MVVRAQVQTIERTSRALRVVGFALVPIYLDPKSGGQPVSRSIQDYVLNQGAFQVMTAWWCSNDVDGWVRAVRCSQATYVSCLAVCQVAPTLCHRLRCRCIQKAAMADQHQDKTVADCKGHCPTFVLPSWHRSRCMLVRPPLLARCVPAAWMTSPACPAHHCLCAYSPQVRRHGQKQDEACS